MPDDPDPPRRVYNLKPTQFEIVNERLRNAPPPNHATEPAAPTPADKAIDVRELNRAAMGTAPLLGVNGPVNRPNEVHAMLEQNVSAANAAGLNDVPLKPRPPSRRKRDYLLLLIPVDAFFAFIAFGPFTNHVTFVYGLAGIALWTTGLTWVMWHVMEDY